MKTYLTRCCGSVEPSSTDHGITAGWWRNRGMMKTSPAQEECGTESAQTNTIRNRDNCRMSVQGPSQFLPTIFFRRSGGPTTSVSAVLYPPSSKVLAEFVNCLAVWFSRDHSPDCLRTTTTSARRNLSTASYQAPGHLALTCPTGPDSPTYQLALAKHVRAQHAYELQRWK